MNKIQNSVYICCLTQGCSLTSISADHKVSRDDVTVTFSADPSHSETVFQCRLDRQRYRSCK